jgi:hypothetical protein
VVQKYVLNEIPDDRLRVYLVWGPMLGEEKEEDARNATIHMTDPRVTHFWTASHQLAEAVDGPLGIEGSRAWDTFLLFGPDARWDGAFPTPSSVMHVGKPLPLERRLNAEKLAQEVRGRLETGKP